MCKICVNNVYTVPYARYVWQVQLVLLCASVFFIFRGQQVLFTQFHIDDKQDTRYKTIISKNNDIKHLRTNFMLHKSARVLPFENVCGTMTVCGTSMFMVFYIEEFEC